jgi:hypothetical protein
LSLTERGSIHRVYCETCKADSQHEVPGATERFHAFFEKYAPGGSLRERRSKALRVTEPRLRVGPRVDRDEEMIFLPPAGPNKGMDERLEPRTGPRKRKWLLKGNGC